MAAIAVRKKVVRIRHCPPNLKDKQTFLFKQSRIKEKLMTKNVFFSMGILFFCWRNLIGQSEPALKTDLQSTDIHLVDNQTELGG